MGNCTRNYSCLTSHEVMVSDQNRRKEKVYWGGFVLLACTNVRIFGNMILTLDEGWILEKNDVR